VEVGNPIWNTFCYCNFFQISTDFEIFNKFQVKSSLTELWSIKLVATAIETPPELNFGQGVFHCALKTLNYDLIDMHKLTPKIQEVIAFTKWLSDKQIQRKCASLESGLHSRVWTLGTIVSPAPNFIQICTLVDHVIRNNFSFESGDLIGLD
jgi:hypothetical protein